MISILLVLAMNKLAIKNNLSNKFLLEIDKNVNVCVMQKNLIMIYFMKIIDYESGMLVREYFYTVLIQLLECVNKSTF